MAYCGPRGIPYLRFMGGPDVWDRYSQAAAIAWDLHDRGRCGRCGTHPDDWDERRGGHREAYRAELVRCHGDELLDALSIPEGEKGLKKQLFPNLDLPMWAHLTGRG